MMSAESNILEIKSLTKIFNSDLLKKNQTAVDDLSFRIPKGKCTGLLGHNGAGKTTTIRLIFGLISPTKGDIFFDGEPLKVSDKRRLGYMPEISKLPPNLTCKEVLRQHLRLVSPDWLKSKDLSDLVKQGLEKVGLGQVANKRIKSLSKGMKRRVAWLQATIHKPDLVILDEPFSGLDPVARYDLLTWIKEFRDEGRSIVLCTHELWTIRELCDQVHVFKKGKLTYSTYDAAENNRTAGFNAAHYQLVISGAGQAEIENLRDTRSLKPWNYLSQQGYLTRLTFTEYETAVSWLSAAIEKGFIIVKFADEISVEDATIHDLFTGGQLQ